MKILRHLVSLSLALPGALLLLPVAALPAAERPNIVFILADDLGYGDVSCYGAADVETPHIDALAAAGVRFANAYAMATECTPSRTSILTGRYPHRPGGLECAIGTGNVGRYDDAIRLADAGELGLPPRFATLAPGLRAAGYYNGVFGKWHLGYEPKFSPLRQGFDEFVGFLGGNVEYFRHFELSDLPAYVSGTEPVEREGYLTDLITADALAFLEGRAAQPERPFFLYLPHAAPHFPFQGPDDGSLPPPTEETWTQGSRETYLAMVSRLDDSVGEVVAALDRHGFAENTLVVFASDHGAMAPGDNSPWRDYKGTLFEGGIRTPLIAKWPGRLEAGTESGQVATLMDLTASFLTLAGAPEPRPPLDGIDILAHVVEGRSDVPRTLHWRYRRGDMTWRGLRDGDDKYVRREEGGEVEEWLFDLASDPMERRNRLEDKANAEAADDAARLLRRLGEREAETPPER